MTLRIRSSPTTGALLPICVLALLLAAPAQICADEAMPRITAEYDGVPLSDVIADLQARHDVQLTLADGVDADTPINASVSDFPLHHALRSMLGPVGLQVETDDGGWLIARREVPEERAVTEARPTRDAPERPAPTREAPPGYEPRVAAEDPEEEERDEVMEIIEPDYFGAGTAAMTFGGGVVEPFVPMGMGGMGGMTGMGQTGGFGTTGGVGTRGGFGTTGGVGTQRPGTQQPGMQRPGTQQPGMQRPGTQQPGTQRPGTQQPGW